MQQSYVLSEAFSSIGNLSTAINAVLAQTTSGWGPWEVVTSFSSSSTAYVVFVRSPIPTVAGSPYVVTP
jgi:hypothetical protein